MSTSTPSGQFFTLEANGLAASQSQMLAIWTASMQTAFPGYTPNPADLEYLQAQIFASWAATCAQLCSAGATELFRQFGVQLLQLPYEDGTPAQAMVTIVAVDDGGYTLPAGTSITLTLSGSQVAFQTTQSLTITAGSTSGQILITAVQSGTAFNGATNPAALVTQTNWVSSVTAAAAASGGVDQEDDDQYVQRLAQTLQLLAPRPITASDYATMALDFQPAAGTDQQEVGRATAIDGYDPTSNTTGNEREVTVCITDSSGLALNSDTLTAVQAYLAAMREVNFIVNVVQPAYTTIYVTVEVVAAAGYTAATVQSNVQASLLAYLTPANFGLPQGAITGWNNTTSIYLSELNSITQTTAGVDHVVTGSLAVGTSASPTNTTEDLQLSGPFPLPLSSTTSIPLTAVTVS